MRWFGHVHRWEEGHIGRRMLGMGIPGRRKRGRPKRRFMDVVREDMRVVGVMEEEAGDREVWRQRICCGDPKRENSKEKEEGLGVLKIFDDKKFHPSPSAIHYECSLSCNQNYYYSIKCLTHA